MSNVSLTPSGPPETILDPEPTDATDRLAAALARDGRDDRRAGVSSVVADHPTFLAGWAELAGLARDDVEAYAYARVGYHRGLDKLRGSGWRGSGYVRWSHPTNRGFLVALLRLAEAAAAIGDTPEYERCEQFLVQLDPGGVPAAERRR